MVSNRCQYALRAMVELARQEGKGLATIAEIARARHIPVRFLESILLTLKQNGFTRSVRGKEGGYLLARSADKISAGDIIRLFEGPLFAPRKTAEAARDVLATLWGRAETAMSEVFDSVSFRELARLDEQSERSAALHFDI
ncbi:MAG TPA: Rrf2 family transcriptional regulator [Kiritimatiellia bacterium]|nr:Rrf2 family transcriptional regulator [Kiritimatiellia bacterium]HRZ12081.1 Rrf2 family transcriptional regulator [Kiritimatiellia bacterium]HSA18161.1 Rrf2 family transcriptional regulator [Kiritimatiellia bacterium]